MADTPPISTSHASPEHLLDLKRKEWAPRWLRDHRHRQPPAPRRRPRCEHGHQCVRARACVCVCVRVAALRRASVANGAVVVCVLRRPGECGTRGDRIRRATACSGALPRAVRRRVCRRWALRLLWQHRHHSWHGVCGVAHTCRHTVIPRTRRGVDRRAGRRRAGGRA